MRTFLVGTLLVASFAAMQQAPAANIADYTLRSPRGQVQLPGRLFIPTQVATDPNTPRPLMVYLHGGGAAGTNNISQIEQTPDPMVDEARARGAYLYVPQAASTWNSESAIDSVMTMINRAIVERNVDSGRLYATGYSNGGGGTWNLLSRNPKRFAAALTISSIAPLSSFNPANLLGTAIFTFHARDDATVPILRTRTVVNGVLSAAGSSLPNYSALPLDQHLLVANPQHEFDSLLMAAQPAGTVMHSITAPKLDLLYFDTYNGGHTGLLSVFYSPAVYEWLYSHSIPEPNTLVLACALVALAATRRWPNRE
jgi:predicted peptidase